MSEFCTTICTVEIRQRSAHFDLRELTVSVATTRHRPNHFDPEPNTQAVGRLLLPRDVKRTLRVCCPNVARRRIHRYALVTRLRSGSAFSCLAKNHATLREHSASARNASANSSTSAATSAAASLHSARIRSERAARQLTEAKPRSGTPRLHSSWISAINRYKQAKTEMAGKAKGQRSFNLCFSL